MVSYVRDIILFIAFASAATASTDETANCGFSEGTLDVYRSPNASSSYSIPAVVSTASTVMNSTIKTWQIINSIGTVSDSSNVVEPQAQKLSQFIFLDTSSTINQTSASYSLPFTSCSFTFALPSSYVGKTSNDGRCGNIFGQTCLNEIMQIAQDNTASVPPAVASMNLIDACDTVSESINNYIATSSKACSKNGPSIEVSLKNDTTLNGAGGGYTQTYLTCTSPKNVTAGSHNPTSAADYSDLRSVVCFAFAFAINALVFITL